MTTKQLERLKSLNSEGLNDAEIARVLGVTYPAVRYYRRDVLGLPGYRGSGGPWAKYTVYSKYTGEYICEGTAREVAEFLGLKQSTIYPEACRTKQGRQTCRYEIIRVDKDDEYD